MSARPTVGIARCASYDTAEVGRALAEVLEPLGGMGAFVRPGQRVLVKLNLLMRSSPERAVTTHPALARAAIREAKAAGAGEVVIGDSPGGRVTGSGLESLLEATGIGELCREEEVRFVSLDEDVTRVAAPDALLYPSFSVGGEVARADVLINLPKMKTHGFMQFTGAVKNLFGCIPGLEKAQFHLKVPDRGDFAEMLLDLMLACRPALSVMDGVVAMEGDGPSGGSPRQVGVLVASADAVALDVVASAIAGFDPVDVYTNRAAARRGLGPADADAVHVVGAAWRDVAVADFVHPVPDLTTRVPRGVAKWARTRLSSYPVLGDPGRCTGCATCEANCPVRAIVMKAERPVFDLGECIRCYCCQELCPQRAIELETPWLARVLLAGGSRRTP